MNTTSAFIVNAILVLLVVRQIREHRMDLRGLAGPVLAVGAAAVFFLRSVPAGGNDLLLELACVAAGAVMGCLSGLFTHLRRDRDGLVLGHAGWVSASLWVTGVGARMAFVFAATHGLGPAIGRFSVAHHITSAQAWAAALVMMALADVLTRLAVLFVRSRRWPPPRPSCPSRRAPAPMSDPVSGPAAGQTVTMRARLAAAGRRRAGEPARPGAPAAAVDPGGVHRDRPRHRTDPPKNRPRRPDQ